MHAYIHSCMHTYTQAVRRSTSANMVICKRRITEKAAAAEALNMASEEIQVFA